MTEIGKCLRHFYYIITQNEKSREETFIPSLKEAVCIYSCIMRMSALQIRFHQINKILVNSGIIRHFRMKGQPNLISILGSYNVSVNLGQDFYTFHWNCGIFFRCNCVIRMVRSRSGIRECIFCLGETTEGSNVHSQQGADESVSYRRNL
mgnify:CR=1 FL=1